MGASPLRRGAAKIFVRSVWVAAGAAFLTAHASMGAAPVAAQSSNPSPSVSQGVIEFDIPAQSLNAALLTFAERAGLALGCSYSSSAEFDAELIAARRAAGVYGPKRHRKQKLATVAGVAAGLAVIVYLIV